MKDRVYPYVRMSLTLGTENDSYVLSEYSLLEPHFGVPLRRSSGRKRQKNNNPPANLANC